MYAKIVSTFMLHVYAIEQTLDFDPQPALWTVLCRLHGESVLDVL